MFNKVIMILLVIAAILAISGIAIVISGLNIDMSMFTHNDTKFIDMVNYCILAFMGVACVAGCVWGCTTKY